MAVAQQNVTIGIEGWNSADLARRDVFLASIQSLKEQTFPINRCEILVVLERGSPDDLADLRALLPQARFLEVEGATYYRSKNLVMQEARGDYIVFADSDVRYDSEWLATLLAAFREGVDIVCGQSRYPPSLLYRTLTFCDWSALRIGAGFTDWFAAHNLAIRRERIADVRFREDMGRSGGGSPNVLREELNSKGLRPWFEPGALAFHHPAPFLLKRLRVGGYHVRWRLQAPEARWSWTARVPVLGPLLATGGTFVKACGRAWRHRSSYPGGALAFPGFVVTIGYCKAFELVGACLYAWAPGWISRRYAWYDVPERVDASQPSMA